MVTVNNSKHEVQMPSPIFVIFEKVKVVSH